MLKKSIFNNELHFVCFCLINKLKKSTGKTKQLSKFLKIQI